MLVDASLDAVFGVLEAGGLLPPWWENVFDRSCISTSSATTSPALKALGLELGPLVAVSDQSPLGSMVTCSTVFGVDLRMLST